jgi:hypothetical protein
VNTVILNYQEVAKSRDKPMWVEMHMSMEEALGISLYWLSSSQTSKNTMSSFYYVLYFLFNKIREQEGGTGSAW